METNAPVTYSPQVLEHFHHPRHAGEVEGATAVIEASNPACGDTLKLWAKVRSGKIAEVAFKAGGCLPAVACGSWLAEWLESRELGALPRLSPEQVESALGGLPPASKHAAVLAVDALRALVEKLAGRPISQ